VRREGGKSKVKRKKSKRERSISAFCFELSALSFLPSALTPTPHTFPKPLAFIVVPFFAEKKEPKKPVENNDAVFSTGSPDGAAVLL
jgi:hypothetical protein